MFRWSTSTFQTSSGCTALDMPEWGETTEQTDWRAKQPSQVACFSEVLKFWEAWDTNLRAQSQWHHTIDRLEERGMQRGSARRSSFERTREGHRQSDEHWNRFKGKRWGNVLETGWNAYGLFRAHRYHLELNWTELRTARPAFQKTAASCKCSPLSALVYFWA